MFGHVWKTSHSVQHAPSDPEVGPVEVVERVGRLMLARPRTMQEVNIMPDITAAYANQLTRTVSRMSATQRDVTFEGTLINHVRL